MTIASLFVGHWILSVFFQSFFLHRYAAHRMFTMSRLWERVFHFMTWVTLGSSYLTPSAYAWLHRAHHAYSDTAKDPHSPHHAANVLRWIWRMKKSYTDLAFGHTTPKDKFKQLEYPQWEALDHFGRSWANEIFWIVVYIALYVAFATAWWQYTLIPIHWLMGRIHGAIVNWCGHKYGYRNFETDDKSCNALPIEVIVGGELFQNNHHKYPMSPNFAVRWFEIDPSYWVVRIFAFFGIVQFAPQIQRVHYP